ncbi:MAG: hypothetical protein U1E27_07915, partial [Kiritimatiellia bacterium]|nr:hypothetical protein [Kiritimatiellia bacterium]
IRQLLLQYALGHPSVGWRLTADGREVHNLPPAGDLAERIRELYGPHLVEALLPVQGGKDSVQVTGFAGLPRIARADRNEQTVFINGRPASAPVLHYAIQEAYHTLLPRGRYPTVFLFLTLDPGDLDVNVHPTKREVRFRNASQVRDVVLEAIRNALAVGSEIALPPTVGPSALPPRPPEPSLRIVDLPAPRTFSYPQWNPVAPHAPISSSPLSATDARTTAAAPAPVSSERPWSWCRVVGQVGGLFVVLETAEGLVLMDPHAAHERVLFERFMKEVLAASVRSQGLLLPETVALGPADARIVRRNLERLKVMGFGVAEFGGDTFVLDAAPTVLGALSGRTLLVDVARGLDEAGSRGGPEKWAEERIAQAACKAAVKARDKLTLEEIEKLVVELASAEMPYTCPHGRPTLIQFSYDELYRKFGRV